MVYIKGLFKWDCPVCSKILYIPYNRYKSIKTCSYECRNKSEYHRKCNSLSKKGKLIPWNKNITGYSTLRKGMFHTEDTKRKMSNVHRFNIDRECAYEKYFKTKVSKPTKYEIIYKNYLIKKNIIFREQVPIGNKYQVDFIINEKDIIEIDGSWHYKKGKLRKEDIERDNFLEQLGYNITHIKNNEVLNYD